MKKPKKSRFLLLIPILIILAALIYQIPFVKDRLSWRIDELKTRLSYALNPPEEAVFIPIGETPLATPDLLFPSSTPDSAAVITTVTPTEDIAQPTSAPLPESVILEDVVYVDQHERWNYCGPANLAMALNYWGWPGDRDDIARVVKPGVNDPDLDFIQQGRYDKNVMPSEMKDFIVDHTDFNIYVRHGGNLNIIKTLIANGFPVLVEKGYYEEDYTGKVAWLGHYLFTTGYDDRTDEFIVQDAYLKPGNNMRVDYETYLEGWRGFNYLFMVIYPPDQQDQVTSLLGSWSDPSWAYQNALEIAESEIQSLTGVGQFFAYFNKGTSLVMMEHYMDAAEAFDAAYLIDAQLVNDETTRPYRITWYQTSPYKAYYFSGRYQDVINLANFTFNTIDDDTLEESLYWRGLAHYALGNKAQAKQDLYQSVWLNPNFGAGLYQISVLLFDE